MTSYFLIYLYFLLLLPYISESHSIFGVNRGKFLLISGLNTAGIYGRLRLSDRYKFVRYLSELNSLSQSVIGYKPLEDEPTIRLVKEPIIGLTGEISSCERVYSVLNQILDNSSFLERDLCAASSLSKGQNKELNHFSQYSPFYVSSLLKRILPQIGGVQALVGGKVGEELFLLLVDGNGEVTEMEVVALGLEMNLLLASAESLIKRSKEIEHHSSDISASSLISSSEDLDIDPLISYSHLIHEAREFVEICWQSAGRRSLADLSKSNTLMLTKSL